MFGGLLVWVDFEAAAVLHWFCTVVFLRRPLHIQGLVQGYQTLFSYVLKANMDGFHLVPVHKPENVLPG